MEVKDSLKLLPSLDVALYLILVTVTVVYQLSAAKFAQQMFIN